MIHKDLPLIDLHRHLDGSIRLETILDLGKKHNLPLPSFDIEELRPYVQVVDPQPGIMEFIAKFKWMVGVLVDYDDCRRVAIENVIDAEKEGIDYIELRFSPMFMAKPNNLDPAGVVASIVEGIQEARKITQTKVNLIGIISRTFGPEIGFFELNALLSHKDDLVGLDLAGDEANFPPSLFKEHFIAGREAGWKITVHAGEAAGAESVWQSILLLGAARIGHAVRIGEDPKLLDYMLDNQIGIEANLTSNFQTSTVSDLSKHPLKSWLDKGLLATINTDDPGISNIDLPHEFNFAAILAGLSNSHTRLAQENAVKLAFLSEIEKEQLKKAKKNTAIF